MYLNKYNLQRNYFIPNINTNTPSIFKSKMLTNCLTICPVSYKDNPIERVSNATVYNHNVLLSY